MLSLAFDDDRRNAPYYLVHLISLDESPDYFSAFGPLLREEQAQVLWRGGLTALHSGRSRDELGDVALIEFASGNRVVQMMTSSTYRDLTRNSRPVLLGAVSPPGPIASDEVLLLWLFELSEGSSGEQLEAIARSADTHQGQLIWATPVEQLGGDRTWNQLLLLAFPDSISAQNWLADPQTTTDRALARRHYQTEALMELTQQ